MTAWPAGGGVTQAGERRSAAVESLRALAALGVLEGHVFGFAVGFGAAAYATVADRMLLGGGMGVFLFFALSGYLLYRPFARRDFAGGTAVRLGRYAANRAVRILPLYYVVLAVTVVVFDHGGRWATWWRSALLLEDFFPSTLAHIDGVMWSLVVEVQFYVLLPLLAAGLRRVAAGRLRRAVAAVALLAATSAAVRVVTVTAATQPSARWQYSLPATFVFFTAGLGLALVEVGWRRRPPALRGPAGGGTWWGVAAVALWAVVAWRYDLALLLVPACFLLVGAVVLPLRPGVLVRALRWRPLAALGVASYSLYLWHYPIVEHLATASWLPGALLARLAVLGPICVAVAGVSYLVVEAPSLRLRRSWVGPTAAVPAPQPVRGGGAAVDGRTAATAGPAGATATAATAGSAGGAGPAGSAAAGCAAAGAVRSATRPGRSWLRR